MSAPPARPLFSLGLLPLLLGAVTPSETAQGVLPKPIATQDLTVPKDRLPDGCSLKTIEPGRQETGTSARGRPLIKPFPPPPPRHREESRQMPGTERIAALFAGFGSGSTATARCGCQTHRL